MKFLLWLLAALILSACRDPLPHKSNELFTEITESSKLKFVHDPGVDGSYFMPESLGSGAALFDYNNDGRLDIYLVNAGSHQNTGSGATDSLFEQQADGAFIDVTKKSGLGDSGYGLGVAAGDLDNDGDSDLYVTNFGRDRMYRNNGNGTFTDITEKAGIKNSRWSASVLFVDFNMDNYLDIYVATYVDYNPATRCTDKAGRPEYCGPKSFPGLPDVLYQNNRDGTFTDVSIASGVASPSLKGLGVIGFDFNDDFYPDIYVANDGEANHLWINQTDGTFRDRAVELGAAVNAVGEPEASMGVTAGDIEGDSDVDLFMTHLRDEKNTLYRNLGALGFQDDSWSTGLAGPSIPFTGFGAGFFDFDNDGDLDIAIANGRIARAQPLVHNNTPGYWDAYAEPNLLFENNGAGNYEDKSKQCGDFCTMIENSRGLAFGDVDNDGDIDLLVTNCGGPARLYRNESRGRNWLQVRAMDPVLKRDALGSRITVQIGNRKIVRYVAPAYSYFSSNDPRVHFGLGSAGKVDNIEVQWPDGSRESFGPVNANQILTLKKGTTKR